MDKKSMKKLKKLLWHPKYKNLVGKAVDITIDGKTYCNRVLHFAGVNMVGQKVVTTDNPERGVYWVENWNDINIQKVSES